ncbi:MAG: zinc metallopeptidase [Gammaproteobacteria bacterium]|nr:zinc metallopeptidase [Gammaproteobacteria bacterium]
MRWRKGRRSSNVEDRRGSSMVGGGAKVGGGMIILALVASFLLGQNPLEVLNSMGGVGALQSSSKPAAPRQNSPEEEAVADFLSVVLADTEDTWGDIFGKAGARYRPPKLVLYSDMVQSACGTNSAAVGPFYCPGDEKVYFELGFLNELQRFGAQGDFAVAYVIAHEIGHHVQNITGTSNKVRAIQARSNQRDVNALSVLLELQADCYAGVWARNAHEQRQILESGDVEEGLGAAASVGDDRLMKAAGRRVHPEAFTHGSAKQREQWFKTGLKSGDIRSCDTFAQSGVRL